jgi:hypothetical protein
MKFTFNGKECEIGVSVYQKGDTSNVVLEKIPVYSAGFKHCGDGGCKDIYKIAVDLCIEVEGSCDGGWDYRKTLSVKEEKHEIFIDGSCDYNVGDKMYRPRLYILPQTWGKTDYPDIEKYLNLNNEGFEKLEDIDLTEYIDIYKIFIIEKEKEIEEKRKIEKEKEEEKKEEHLSIGDYNSSWGVTSTWSGDAGWMDDD